MPGPDEWTPEQYEKAKAALQGNADLSDDFVRTLGEAVDYYEVLHSKDPADPDPVDALSHLNAVDRQRALGKQARHRAGNFESGEGDLQPHQRTEGRGIRAPAEAPGYGSRFLDMLPGDVGGYFREGMRVLREPEPPGSAAAAAGGAGRAITRNFQDEVVSQMIAGPPMPMSLGLHPDAPMLMGMEGPPPMPTTGPIAGERPGREADAERIPRTYRGGSAAEDVRRTMDAEGQAQSERYPRSTILGETGGALAGSAPMVAMMPGGPGLPMAAARVGLGMLEGGAEAGVSAAGAAQPGQRMEAAKQAAPIGAAFGGGGALLGEVGGAMAPRLERGASMQRAKSGGLTKEVESGLIQSGDMGGMTPEQVKASGLYDEIDAPIVMGREMEEFGLDKATPRGVYEAATESAARDGQRIEQLSKQLQGEGLPQPPAPPQPFSDEGFGPPPQQRGATGTALDRPRGEMGGSFDAAAASTAPGDVTPPAPRTATARLPEDAASRAGEVVTPQAAGLDSLGQLRRAPGKRPRRRARPEAPQPRGQVYPRPEEARALPAPQRQPGDWRPVPEGGDFIAEAQRGLADEDLDYLRSGMRPESADHARAQRQSGAAGEPIDLMVEVEDGKYRWHLIDGRHRLGAAREAGAPEVQANIRVRQVVNGKATDSDMGPVTIPTPGGARRPAGALSTQRREPMQGTVELDEIEPPKGYPAEPAPEGEWDGWSRGSAQPRQPRAIDPDRSMFEDANWVDHAVVEAAPRPGVSVDLGPVFQQASGDAGTLRKFADLHPEAASDLLKAEEVATALQQGGGVVDYTTAWEFRKWLDSKAFNAKGALQTNAAEEFRRLSGAVQEAILTAARRESPEVARELELVNRRYHRALQVRRAAREAVAAGHHSRLGTGLGIGLGGLGAAISAATPLSFGAGMLIGAGGAAVGKAIPASGRAVASRTLRAGQAGAEAARRGMPYAGPASAIMLPEVMDEQMARERLPQ